MRVIGRDAIDIPEYEPQAPVSAIAVVDRVIAIDPGPVRSAWVEYAPGIRSVRGHGIDHNGLLIPMLKLWAQRDMPQLLVIEQVASYGMPVGEEIFETVFWTGRFAQAWEWWGGTWRRMKRLAVKLSLCRDSRARDPNIRAALIDLFGPGTAQAIGTKKRPGPLYGIRRDEWAALAVAVAWVDSQAAGMPEATYRHGEQQ